MKRFAANKVMLDAQTLWLNAVVECDNTGVVIAVSTLENQLSEPASTFFFNGLITTEVCLTDLAVGMFIPDLLTHSLSVGYHGKLILWQNINLATLKVPSDTETRVL